MDDDKAVFVDAAVSTATTGAAADVEEDIVEDAIVDASPNFGVGSSSDSVLTSSKLVPGVDKWVKWPATPLVTTSFKMVPKVVAYPETPLAGARTCRRIERAGLPKDVTNVDSEARKSSQIGGH